MLTDKEIARALLSVLESTNFLGASIEQVIQAKRWLEAIESGAKEVVATHDSSELSASVVGG